MNWAQLTLKQVEKRSEVITSYKTNVNYIWFNRYISASNQPWHASAGSPMGFLGEFSGDASLVRSDGWSDWAECTRATKCWSAAGSTASWPFGNNSPISYLPIPSTVPEKVKLNQEIKVIITIINSIVINLKSTWASGKNNRSAALKRRHNICVTNKSNNQSNSKRLNRKHTGRIMYHSCLVGKWKIYLLQCKNYLNIFSPKLSHNSYFLVVHLVSITSK